MLGKTRRNRCIVRRRCIWRMTWSLLTRGCLPMSAQQLDQSLYPSSSVSLNLKMKVDRVMNSHVASLKETDCLRLVCCLSIENESDADDVTMKLFSLFSLHLLGPPDSSLFYFKCITTWPRAVVSDIKNPMESVSCTHSQVWRKYCKNKLDARLSMSANVSGVISQIDFQIKVGLLQ